MKCQTCFMGKTRKSSICHLLKILPSMLSIHNDTYRLGVPCPLDCAVSLIMGIGFGLPTAPAGPFLAGV